MKLVKNKIIIFFIILIACLNLGFSFDITKYNYHSTINVACSEYLGNVEFAAPNQFNENMKIYFDSGPIYFKKGSKSLNYIKTNNWYSSRINGINIIDSEKIFDNNYNSYLIIENKSNSQIIFKNPQNINLNKILIEIKDSNIKSINLYDKFNNPINFKSNKKLFTYELNFDKDINLNYIKMEFTFNDILKIREISFFEKRQTNSNSKFYFYLNNQCNKTFNLYFGKYGENNLNYYSNINLPVSFNVNVNTTNNNFYSNDFDKDGILNENDNCKYTKNANQTDINYNKIGDACEDFDNDGILNNKDNCPNTWNPSQLDADKDGIGNVCDTNGDQRFFEKNNYLIYIIIGVILLVFIGLSVLIMRKK